MKKTNTIFGSLLLLFIFLDQSNMCGQNNTVSSGGEAVGTGGTVSYSIGQVDYAVAAGSDGTITQGIQQPYEILVISGIDRNDIRLNVTVYPNPTANNMELSVEGFDTNSSKSMSYCLYNLQGKVLSQQVITAAHTKIMMQDFESATYLIEVRCDKAVIKTFKVEKVH